MALAARGARETDTGIEPVEDESLRAALRKRMVRVYVLTAVTAIAITAAIWFLPA